MGVDPEGDCSPLQGMGVGWGWKASVVSEGAEEAGKVQRIFRKDREGGHDCGAGAERNSVGERESTGYLRGWEGVGSFFWKNLKFSLDSCTGSCYNKQRI